MVYYYNVDILLQCNMYVVICVQIVFRTKICDLTKFHFELQNCQLDFQLFNSNLYCLNRIACSNSVMI